MNSLLTITATIERLHLLESMVEKLARRKSIFVQEDKISVGCWASFHTSSVEAYLEGNLICKDSNERPTSSFAAPFLFTCMDADGQTALLWSQSLN